MRREYTAFHCVGWLILGAIYGAAMMMAWISSIAGCHRPHNPAPTPAPDVPRVVQTARVVWTVEYANPEVCDWRSDVDTWVCYRPVVWRVIGEVR